MEKTISALRNIVEKLLIEFAKSISEQGHVASGKLISSLETKYIIDEKVIEVQILFEDYGQYVDRGRRSETKRVPISALEEWIRIKGIASEDKEVRSIAFAIQRKIFKEGIPTRNSLKFSSTGKRTDWFNDVVNENEKNIEDLLTEMVEKDSDIILENVLKNRKIDLNQKILIPV